MRNSPSDSHDRFEAMHQHLNFNSFAESLNDGLYVSDSETRLVYVNTGLAKILGYTTPDEVIGKPFLDFIEPACLNEIKEKYLQYYLQYLRIGSSSMLITTKIIRKDGSVGMIEIKPGRADPGFSRGVVRDITEIRKTEQQLREMESLYKSIVELSPDAIILSSLEGLILDFNEKALNLFNYQKKESVQGLWIGSFANPPDQVHLKSLLIETIQKGERLNIEIILVRSDSSTFLGEVSTKMLATPDGDKPLLMILARDITERKAAEEQLMALSVTDPLTKLFNRRGFTIAAEQEMRHAKRVGAQATILFMDLNGMKKINDAYGHEMGDQVLIAVAQAIRETFRDSDIIGRIGGDEFVVYAVNAPIKTAQTMVTRLKENLKSCSFPFEVSLASGAAEYDKETDLSLAQLIKQADTAMYQEKNQYRSES